MNVKKILLHVCTMLQLNEIKQEIIDGQTSAEVELLVDCVNYVNNIIATDYINLYTTVQVSTTGKIAFNQISPHTFLGVKKVTDSNGNRLEFTITSDGIDVDYSGVVTIQYAHFPADVTIDDSITCYPTKLNERIFAYGVAGEYLFIKGVIDDASMWDTRFKRDLLVVTRKLTDVKIRPRKFK